MIKFVLGVILVGLGIFLIISETYIPNEVSSENVFIITEAPAKILNINSNGQIKVFNNHEEYIKWVEDTTIPWEYDGNGSIGIDFGKTKESEKFIITTK